MKSNLPLSFLLSLIFCLTACKKNVKGEGPAEYAQDFKVENFDGVYANGHFKLILIPNDSTYVSVQSHKNLIENTDIYVRTNKITIQEKKPVSSFDNYVVYLYYNQDIQGVEIDGSVQLETASEINFDRLLLNAKGNSKVDNFAFNAKNCRIDSDQNSNIKLIGEISDLKIRARDNAQIDGTQAETQNLEVDLVGNTAVTVNVNKRIKGVVAENAILTYLGNPEKEISVKGNGQILNK